MENQNLPENQPARPAYSTPELKRYGKVTDLTLGAGSGAPDDGAFSFTRETEVT